MSDDKTVYHSAIWHEQAESDNPFAAQSCYSHGYDVYNDIMPQATWAESLFLLFMGERPSREQALLLEKIAVILAHTSMRDASCRAAMNSGVSGATHAATLMASLAVGAGQYGGAHEVALMVQLWQRCGHNLELWQSQLLAYRQPKSTHHVADIWHDIEHPIGFDPHQPHCPTTIQNALCYLASISTGQALVWLLTNQTELESIAKSSLALTGVIAAAFYDLGFNEHQAEMLYLMLRLPSAAVFALEQQQLGWRKFPFFGNHIRLQED